VGLVCEKAISGISLYQYAYKQSKMAAEVTESGSTSVEFGFTDALNYAMREVGIEFELKAKQLETLEALYEGRDCVTVVPTGYGKSLG
jgi:superfamily II DNA helicase RecQ